jgi:hypothetical protein
MRICEECINRYYEDRFSCGVGSYGKGTYLCDYCNQYGDLYGLHSGAKTRRRLPLKREDRLRRMFIIAHVDIDCEWGPGGLFEGPIEDLVRTLTGFASKALYAGYTHVHFREEGDYDGTSYVPYGVRQETDEEMKKRFRKIRQRRERKRERRNKNAAKKV